MAREWSAPDSDAHAPPPPTQRAAAERALLHTKLVITGSTPTLLSRPRLNALLADQPGGRLALISAPAGYGKTTLVIDALRRQGSPTAWLTLDPQDNDPILFWRYVVAALQRVEPRLGLQAQSALSVISPVSWESALTLLLNDLEAYDAPGGLLTLVLDDLHWLHTAAIFQSLNFLLQHQPAQLRILLVTRSDPPLSLARLRVESRLLELRAADLRLTPEEITAFCNEIMALQLPAEALDLLATQTEGWAAGLQLAALSLRQTAAPSAAHLRRSLAGSNQHVFAYLVEEVLRQQPPDVRAFLQQTAVLPQFSAPLCAAVTGLAHSQQILDHLAAENLFITPLDEASDWYRYHPLFAEALRNQLEPDTQRRCRQRAARWYAEQQFLQEAIRSALAAEDFPFVASLLVQNYKDFLAHGLLVSLQQWLAALPVAYQTPRLRLACAWCRVYASSEQELEQLMAEIEPYLDEADTTLRGEMRAIQAVYASLYGDLQQSIQHAAEALAWTSPDDCLSRAAAYQALGNVYRYQGELDAAFAAYGQARQEFARLGQPFMSQLPHYRSAHVLILQGRLHQALRTYESVRQLAQEAGHEPVLLSGEIFGYLSELFGEWNDLDRSLAFAQREIELAQSGQMRLALVDGYLRLAAATAARGDWVAAQAALGTAAETAAQLRSLPVTAQVAMAQARLELDRGNLPAAATWADQFARQRGTPACALTPLLVQSAVLLLARIRLAQGQMGLALALLDEALHQAEAAGRTRLVVEASVLQALAWHRQGEMASSRKALIRALAAGKAEDYVRVFVENGPSLGPLLQQVRHLFPAYVSRLLEALQGTLPEGDGGDPLLEHLTAREREIVALIAQGYSNREIAGTLHLSVGTVKGHINHLFGKLDVRNRTQALLRARELHLLDS